VRDPTLLFTLIRGRSAFATREQGRNCPRRFHAFPSSFALRRHGDVHRAAEAF
jgi:hypothetical protein